MCDSSDNSFLSVRPQLPLGPWKRSPFPATVPFSLYNLTVLETILGSWANVWELTEKRETLGMRAGGPSLPLPRRPLSLFNACRQGPLRTEARDLVQPGD